MTKRERVMAALRGAEVDRPPLSFWLHNFATENSAQSLATETLRLARTFDWDFLEPQSRAQCCSINPDTPEPLLHAVGAAVRGGPA